MKTKNIFVMAMVTVGSIIGLSSFTSMNTFRNESVEETHTHIQVQGAHCNGTVGCACSGFSPITGGEVWQQAYCRHCSHKKSVHK